MVWRRSQRGVCLRWWRLLEGSLSPRSRQTAAEKGGGVPAAARWVPDPGCPRVPNGLRAPGGCHGDAGSAAPRSGNKAARPLARPLLARAPPPPAPPSPHRRRRHGSRSGSRPRARRNRHRHRHGRHGHGHGRRRRRRRGPGRFFRLNADHLRGHQRLNPFPLNQKIGRCFFHDLETSPNPLFSGLIRMEAIPFLLKGCLTFGDTSV